MVAVFGLVLIALMLIVLLLSLLSSRWKKTKDQTASAKNKGMAYGLIIGLLLYGIVLVLADFWGSDDQSVGALLLGIGVLAVWCALHNVVCKMRCQKKVLACCVEHVYVGGGKGPSYYSAVFAYEVDGKTYRGQDILSFTFHKIRKLFVIGEEYTVFCDASNPVRLVSDRWVTFGDILLLLTGILLIVGGFILLIV